MGFPTSVAERALLDSGRHCCICGEFRGSKIELHHIIPRAQGGPDTYENCIPLCFDCHAEVEAYNPKHPKGRRYSASELRSRRDRLYQWVRDNPGKKPAPNQLWLDQQKQEPTSAKPQQRTQTHITETRIAGRDYTEVRDHAIANIRQDAPADDRLRLFDSMKAALDQLRMPPYEKGKAQWAINGARSAAEAAPPDKETVAERLREAAAIVKSTSDLPLESTAFGSLLIQGVLWAGKTDEWLAL